MSHVHSECWSLLWHSRNCIFLSGNIHINNTDTKQSIKILTSVLFVAVLAPTKVTVSHSPVTILIDLTHWPPLVSCGGCSSKYGVSNIQPLKSEKTIHLLVPLSKDWKNTFLKRKMSIEFTLYKNIKPYIHAKNYIEITYVNFLHVFLLPKKKI